MTAAANRGERTPGPWATNLTGDSIYQDIGAGRTIATVSGDGHQNYQRKANAALIVTACNAHDDLVKALEDIAADHKTYKGHGDYDEGPHPGDYCQKLARTALSQLTPQSSETEGK